MIAGFGVPTINLDNETVSRIFAAYREPDLGAKKALKDGLTATYGLTEVNVEMVGVWDTVGARGILYPRWRGMLNGPLFWAFGPFAMDGSVTPRAEMCGKVAKWANSHAEAWKSHPVMGDVGLVFVPESELFNSVQQRAAHIFG
jgi:hypothetical protein